MDEYTKMMEELQKQAMEMQQQVLEQSGMDINTLVQANSDWASLFEGEEEMSDEDFAAFLAQNAPSAEHARYLPIGALLIGTHDEPYETLVLLQDRDYTDSVLSGGWGIEGREDALEMLDSLLAGRHANLFKEEFEALREGRDQDADAENAEDFHTTVDAIVEVLELPRELATGCPTLYGWDLERIGYLARLFYNIGYITEAEAWEWMAKAGAKVKETFTSWESYIVSVLLGRGFAMGIHPEPFAVALDLLTDRRDFLDAHPISGL